MEVGNRVQLYREGIEVLCVIVTGDTHERAWIIQAMRDAVGKNESLIIADLIEQGSR